MGMDNQITAIQYAEAHGLNWSMVKSTFHRNGMSTGKHTVLTVEMLAVLSGQKPAAATPKPRVLKPRIQHQPKPDAEPKAKPQPKEKPETKPQTAKEPAFATAILWAIVAAPTVASGNNIVRVCMSIMGERVGGLTLAAVICLTSMALTYVGMRSGLARWLIWFVLAFETLANITTIYDGLMGGVGNPTRFLGVVTTICNSGTHGTAIVLALFAALLLAGAQFAGLFELKKRS